MFCPKCRAEFVEGIGKCPDCQVSLVGNLPSESEIFYEDYETVFSTADPGIIAIAESLLNSESIRFAKKGEGLQSIYGLGVVEFQVAPKLKERAFDLLKDLKETGDEKTSDE